MHALEKNTRITLDIDTMGSEGQGIGRLNGLAVFVPLALPGETVEALVIKSAKNYAVAKLLDIKKPSPHRVTPQCPLFGKCGGCTLMQLEYAEQLEIKRKTIADALERIGGVKNAEELTPPVIGMDDPYRSRNKGAFPAGRSEKGVELGLYSKHSHRVVPTADCLLQTVGCMSAVNAVKRWANDFDVPAYDQLTGKGALRHVVARTSRNGDVMATLVTTGALPHKNELVEYMRRDVENVVSIMHSVNKDAGNVILGDNASPVWGAPALSHELMGLTLEVSALSFLQVNHVQAEALYKKALEFAELDSTKTVVDAYCGIGTISLLMARQAKRVTGVEIVPQAIEDARANAARCGITNAEFICAPAETALPKLLKTQPDVLVLDPPRKGCDRALIDAVNANPPQKLVYVSCDPATLARDIALLSGNYSIKRAQGVDMFPMTSAVECVAELQLK